MHFFMDLKNCLFFCLVISRRCMGFDMEWFQTDSYYIMNDFMYPRQITDTNVQDQTTTSITTISTTTESQGQTTTTLKPTKASTEKSVSKPKPPVAAPQKQAKAKPGNTKKKPGKKLPPRKKIPLNHIIYQLRDTFFEMRNDLRKKFGMKPKGPPWEPSKIWANRPS